MAVNAKPTVSGDDLSDFEKDTSINVSSFNVDEYSPSLIVSNKGSFKWLGEFEALQRLFNDILKNETSWSKPGGSCRKLEVDQLIVRWYSDSHSLTINGYKDEKVKSCLREFAKEAVEHDMNTLKTCFEAQNDESTCQINSNGGDANFFSVDSRTPPRWSYSSLACAQNHIGQRLPKNLQIKIITE